MRAALLEELKTKYQPPSLPPSLLPPTTTGKDKRQNKYIFSTWKNRLRMGKGQKWGQLEAGWRPSLLQGWSWWLQQPPWPGPHPFLAPSQISAFPPSLHALWQHPRMLLLRCPISTTTPQAACPTGYPMPLQMERNIGKATCGSSATECPQHTTFYIWRG